MRRSIVSRSMKRSIESARKRLRRRRRDDSPAAGLRRYGILFGEVQIGRLKRKVGAS